MTLETHPSAHATRRVRPRLIALTATGAIALLIGGLTLTPAVTPPSMGLALTDKVYHLIAFASLVFPAAIILTSRLVALALAAFFYGGAIEAIQPLVGRAAELADLAANTGGIAIGIALGWALRTVYRARRLKPPASPDA